MAYALCLQDWVTVTSNPAGGATISQPEPGWVDVADFVDLAFFVEVANTSSVATLNIQASPTKDEAFFGASQTAAQPWLFTYGIATGANGVQTVNSVRWSTQTSNQVPARYLRWRLRFPASANNTINFRIWLVLNQAGWRGGANIGSTLAASRM